MVRAGRRLPVLPRLDRAARRRRTRSRCQRRIVSGVTSSRIPWRRAFGITLSRIASRARSAQFRFGRRGCRCCRTASWWRSIKISAVFHVSSRWDSRSHAASRMIRRNTNRRPVIDDHQGPSAGRAHLLVRAMDGILGTHRSYRRRHPPPPEPTGRPRPALPASTTTRAPGRQTPPTRPRAQPTSPPHSRSIPPSHQSAAAGSHPGNRIPRSWRRLRTDQKAENAQSTRPARTWSAGTRRRARTEACGRDRAMIHNVKVVP